MLKTYKKKNSLIRTRLPFAQKKKKKNTKQTNETFKFIQGITLLLFCCG